MSQNRERLDGFGSLLCRGESYPAINLRNTRGGVRSHREDQPDTDHPPEIRRTVEPNGEENKCEICGKGPYKGKLGLGQHLRKAHPDQAMERAKVQHQAKKRVEVSVDEKVMIARVEIELLNSGTINQYNPRVKVGPSDILKRLETTELKGIKLDRIKNLRKTIKYKEIIQSLREEGQRTTPVTVQVEYDWKTPVTQWIVRNSLIDGLVTGDGEMQEFGEIERVYNNWVKQKLDPTEPKQSPPRRNEGRVDDQTLRKSDLKRKLMFETFKNYRNDKFKTLKRILDGKSETVTPQEPPNLFEYWKTQFENPSSNDNRETNRKGIQWRVCRPICAEEVKYCLDKSAETAAGIDGIKKCDLRKVAPKELATWMNVFMLNGKLPEALMGGMCSLIPKVQTPKEPTDYRPITVTSKLRRLFHSVLNNRLAEIPLSVRQKGFRSVDGCAENTFILKELLSRARKNVKPLYLAFLDVKNAFGSVSHSTLFKAAERMGVPPPLVSYLGWLYSSEWIRFRGSEETSRVNCGVLQGDPLSGTLFNFVVDYAVNEMTFDYGHTIGTTKLRYGAFADDIWLAADTKIGLSALVKTYTDAMAKSGCSMKPSKCATFALVADKQRRKWFVDKEPFVKINQEFVPAKSIVETYKYLGLHESVTGSSIENLKTTVNTKLQRLSDACLKPQWKLAGLRKCLLPSTYHQLVLSNCGVGVLRYLDKRVRQYVRKWLHLPHNITVHMFSTAVELGGMGIPSLETTILRMRQDRLKRLMHSSDAVVRELFKDSSQIGKNKPKLGRIEIQSKEHQRIVEAEALYETLDGKGLKNICSVPKINNWVNDPALDIKGGEYVKAIKVRCNALDTNSRSSRGRPGNGLCSKCKKPETLGHILSE